MALVGRRGQRQKMEFVLRTDFRTRVLKHKAGSSDGTAVR